MHIDETSIDFRVRLRQALDAARHIQPPAFIWADMLAMQLAELRGGKFYVVRENEWAITAGDRDRVVPTPAPRLPFIYAYILECQLKSLQNGKPRVVYQDEWRLRPFESRDLVEAY